MVDNSHKAIQLTEEVIADIERENRQFSVLEDEAVGLRRERDSERSRRQQLEKETRELQASNESGQLVLDELSGLKAILQGQMGQMITRLESDQGAEGLDETVLQVHRLNDDLVRRFDQTDIQLKECLQSLKAVYRLTELLEAEKGPELENHKFQEIAVELARATSSHDPSFCNMIQGLEFNELPIKICKSLEAKLKEMLPRTREATDLFRLLGQVKSAGLMDQDGMSLAHSIRVQRNQLVHQNIHPDTTRARVLFILLAASLLWPTLPEDTNHGTLKLAA